MAGGIYQIENVVTGARYIGRTAGFTQRWANHICELRAGKHRNINLQRSFTKHGEAAFRFKPLVIVGDQRLRETLEQTWLDNAPGEYNLSRSALTGVAPGSTLSAAHKAALSKAASLWQRGRKLTPEHSANIRKAQQGAKRSEETKRRISAALKGRPKSLDHRAAISKARSKIAGQVCSAA